MRSLEREMVRISNTSRGPGREAVVLSRANLQEEDQQKTQKREEKEKGKRRVIRFHELLDSHLASSEPMG